ncbi:hypothetical protein JB92DRAFT_2914771 [Gautieria morchelliformis]|nr:hypothetical protein JB92DRAFT_2914771 [Gautieria morchelliformis]
MHMTTLISGKFERAIYKHVPASSTEFKPDNGGSNQVNGLQVSQASSASGSVSESAVSAAAVNIAPDVRGDKQCAEQLICITGTVSGSTVTYELQSTSSQSLGWMAVGFGDRMANTPMVVMWPNINGSMTLSQRQAPGAVMPTPVASPTSVATPATRRSTLTGSQPVLAFTITGSATQETLIWAFSTARPSSAADSPLKKHDAAGRVTLDLTRTLTSINGTIVSSPFDPDPPLLPYQKMIIAHAVVATFGFLFLLPGGVLLARYTRTISSKWFTGHWVLQAALAGPVIIVGCALGIVPSQQLGIHLSTRHQILGVVLLVLYFVQCVVGALIHFVKVPFKTRFGRPPQNYCHAILGLAILALAFYQIRIGFRDEWPIQTGRLPVPKAVYIVWVVWLVAFSVLYFGGLGYLPRQWRQERESAKAME